MENWHISYTAWAKHYDLNNPSDFVKKCNESRQRQEAQRDKRKEIIHKPYSKGS